MTKGTRGGTEFMNVQTPGFVLLTLMLCHFSPTAAGQEFTSSLSGAELLERCRHATDILGERSRNTSFHGLAQAAYCAGFVEAAADVGSFFGELDVPAPQSEEARQQRSIRNCAGPAVRGEELLRIVVQFLEDHPESGDQAAVSATLLAIARAFPCEGQA